MVILGLYRLVRAIEHISHNAQHFSTSLESLYIFSCHFGSNANLDTKFDSVEGCRKKPLAPEP